MSAGFTPGPWTAYGIEVVAGEHGDRLVCTEVSEANARLIAASPELFDIADALARAPVEACQDYRVSAARKAAKALIAKIGGDQ